MRFHAEAVPKKILERMNVDGITRENVASHLQVTFLLIIAQLDYQKSQTKVNKHDSNTINILN